MSVTIKQAGEELLNDIDFQGMDLSRLSTKFNFLHFIKTNRIRNKKTPLQSIVKPWICKHDLTIKLQWIDLMIMTDIYGN